MSAVAVKLQDDGKVRMVSAPSIVSNPIEMATIRKLRIRLLPFLFALYVVAFIDRINLGFAALTMNRELAITSQQFGFAAGIFFWGYFLFEILAGAT
jgi:ACS family tartrate transporter-like MFS transporter